MQMFFSEVEDGFSLLKYCTVSYKNCFQFGLQMCFGNTKVVLKKNNGGLRCVLLSKVYKFQVDSLNLEFEIMC